jgi:hypothetical protein
MRKATAAFSQFAHLIMKIRTILMPGCLLEFAAVARQEAQPEAASGEGTLGNHVGDEAAARMPLDLQGCAGSG